MPAFLLDVHVPAAVVEGVHAERPTCRVEHLARWERGALRTADDEDILIAAHEANLVLVTYDLGTIPAILRRWAVEGHPCAGVVLVPARAIAPSDVGAIVRALIRLYDDPPAFDPTYPVVYLRPTR